MAPIRIGIGGWTFAPWRGTFYPKGLPHGQELAYAGARLTSIEINGTFYRQQSPASFAAWRDATPDGFVFAVKAHRASTHTSDPAAARAAIERFLTGGLAELGAKLGPILWQFPPTRKFSEGAMGTFLEALPATLNGVRLRHAVEARHPSFDDPAWIGLARAHGVAVAIIDSGKQALRGDVSADFIYARLQNNIADAPEGYATAALDTWAERLRCWSSGCAVDDLTVTASRTAMTELPCFVYFISGDKERAPESALAMITRCRKEAVPF